MVTEKNGVSATILTREKIQRVVTSTYVHVEELDVVRTSVMCNLREIIVVMYVEDEGDVVRSACCRGVHTPSPNDGKTLVNIPDEMVETGTPTPSPVSIDPIRSVSSPPPAVH